jgi:transcriptional regulator with XRE-family HTH domain
VDYISIKWIIKIYIFTNKLEQMESIGTRIKRFRELKNLTQEHIAEKLGISQNSYSRLENESVKITTERLKEIAVVLDVPAEYLLNTDAPIYNFSNNASIKYAGQFDNIYDGQKELLQKTIEILETQLKEANEDRKRLLLMISELTKNK